MNTFITRLPAGSLELKDLLDVLEAELSNLRFCLTKFEAVGSVEIEDLMPQVDATRRLKSRGVWRGWNELRSLVKHHLSFMRDSLRDRGGLRHLRWIAMIVGFALYSGTSLQTDPGRIARIASLAVDPRWPFAFRRAVSSSLTLSRKQVVTRLPSKNADAVVRELLAAPSCQRLFCNVSAKESLDKAAIDIGTGASFSYSPEPIVCLASLNVDPSITPRLGAWVELVHEMAEVFEAATGIITVRASHADGLADTAQGILAGSALKTPIPSDLLAEVQLAARNKLQLARDRVRHPRWGNYLSRHHIEAAGGVDAIRERVKPEAIRSIGKLTFIQLSESILDPADAWEAKRRRLEALLRPVIVGN